MVIDDFTAFSGHVDEVLQFTKVRREGFGKVVVDVAADVGFGLHVTLRGGGAGFEQFDESRELKGEYRKMSFRDRKRYDMAYMD